MAKEIVLTKEMFENFTSSCVQALLNILEKINELKPESERQAYFEILRKLDDDLDDVLIWMANECPNTV